MLDSSVARRTFLGFFIFGLLMAFPGAILPAWGYHSKAGFGAVGMCFLALNAGLVISARVALALIPVRGAGTMLAAGCLLAFTALLYLSEVSPPFPEGYRIAGFLFLGGAAGLINAAIFHTLNPLFRHSPALAVNLAGTFFGVGSLVTALLISGTYYVYEVPSVLFLLSMIPMFAGIDFARATWPAFELRKNSNASWLPPDTRTLPAVFLSLMFFLQFANEWSIAGWLAVFLIRRLGVSPPTAVGLLALYWLALVVGRLVSQFLLAKVSHIRLLMSAVTSAMIGCLLLTFTTNVFGAVLGVLTVGGAFSVTYPLFVERIGVRFPSYQPGLYNGIFTLALTGGMLAPALLAIVANEAGIQAVMLLPMAGSVLVFLLLGLAMLFEKLRKSVLSEP
jgi:MFS transporter, FHS family, glucose/mannose:H+ symporter